MEKITFSFLAAKSAEMGEYWIPLRLHLLDTASVMRFLLNVWVPQSVTNSIDSENNSERICTFLALVHDIGKATRLFQYRISKAVPGHKERLSNCGVMTDLNPDELQRYAAEVPHARAGQAILERFGFPADISCVVGGHHGKTQENSTDEEEIHCRYPNQYYGYNPSEQTLWEEMWKDWLDFALEYAGYNSIEELPTLTVSGQMLAMGLLVMADWIASNQDYFPPIEIGAFLSDDEILARADMAMENVNLPGFWDAQCFSMDEDGFRERFSFCPNAVQSAILDVIQNAIEPGLVILEAQMGVGKTEAALAAAEYLNTERQCGGLFFGLPTQATANGIFGRLLSWAESQSQESTLAIRLAHAAAALNDDYTSLFRGNAEINDASEECAIHNGLTVHPWFEGGKQALLANFVVGTVDQLLMASLKQKHLMLRHLGLAGKVVIIDECHAYDAYMNTYLERTLRWLGTYKTPVILLSATLPSARRAALVDAYLGNKIEGKWRTSTAYPLLTWTDTGENEPVQQMQVPMNIENKVVAIESISVDSLISYLRKKLDNGGCAGIIVNTVHRAQEIARSISENLPEHEVILCHSQFLTPDRATKEMELLRKVGKYSTAKDRDRLIVIGTQVLEQSLDLDFDVLVTDLCPMDLLLQRIGRLHRHQRQRPEHLKKARCAVLWEADGSLPKESSAIYGEWLLQRTKESLPDTINLPDSIPELVQAVYSEPEDTSPEWEKHSANQQRKRSKADVYCIQMPKKSRRGNKTLNGLFNNDIDNPADAEAAVRDGDPSIDVIVLQQLSDGSVHFLPWQYDGALIPLDEVPGNELGRRIASQKLRLPHRFCTPWRIDAAIAALEKSSYFSVQLQKSPWLHGELFLLLDLDFNFTLLDETLHYDKEHGLQLRKET